MSLFDAGQGTASEGEGEDHDLGPDGGLPLTSLRKLKVREKKVILPAVVSKEETRGQII